MTPASAAHAGNPPVVVGMTGSTGAIYAVELLRALRGLGVPTHLVMSDWAKSTLQLETDYDVKEVLELATVVHAARDQSAEISSGSFLTRGMVIAPCSMNTLAAIANGITSNLVHRAADVTIKERRRLVLAVRETPLSPIHLKNMLTLARLGVVIMPPVPAFYTKPRTLADVVQQSVGRILDQLAIPNTLAPRWRESDFESRGAQEAGQDEPPDEWNEPQ